MPPNSNYDPEVEDKKTAKGGSNLTSNSTSGQNDSFSRGDDLDPVRRMERSGGLYNPHGDSTAGPGGGATSRTGGSEGGAQDSAGRSSGGSKNPTSGPGAAESPGQIAGREAGAGGSDDTVGQGYSEGSSNSTGKKKRPFYSSRRNKAIIGVGTSTIVGATFGFFSISSGPGQLVQLSQILQRDFTKSQSDSESRTDNLLRDYKAYKTGDYRYTRVGLMGAKIMDRVVGQFEDAGVKFTGSDILGRPTGIEVDQQTVAKEHPEVKDMDSEEFDNWLNTKFDVDEGMSFKDGKLNIEGLKASAIRDFIGNASTEILGDNAAISAAKTRSLKEFFGLDSLFHPFSRAIDDKIAAKAAELKQQNPKEPDGEAQNQAEDSVENSEFSNDTAPETASGDTAWDTTKETSDGAAGKIVKNTNQILGYVWVTGCTLKGAGKEIVTINRDLTVLPSALEATSLIADGAHIQNGGSDVTLNQVGGVVNGLTNKQGQTIWSGAALQATAGGESPTKDSNGDVENDLPDDYKQAFGSQTFATNITDAGNFLLNFVPTSALSLIPGASAVGLSQCGIVTALFLAAGGIVWQGLQILADPESGGGSEAAGLALKFTITKAAEEGVNAILGSKLLGFVTNQIINAKTAPALARDAFSGPIGGNLIAYGARAAANISAILGGGLSVANNTSTIVGSAGQEEQQQFSSESFFAKMFDINDTRSLLGHFSMDVNQGFMANMASAINNILNVGGSLANAFANFLPKTAAAGNTDSWTGDYDWGFPQYGIPNNMLNDPALADPYTNAETVGKYLSSVCVDSNGNIGPDNGACAGSNGYTARITACFGNNLTYTEDSDVGGNVWDVEHAATAASSDVDPNSDAYQNANCDDICSDTIADCGNADEENWEKIVMFINDAWNIKTLDCLAGNSDTSDQSCQDTGIDSSDSSSSSSSGTGSSTAGTSGTGTGKFTTNTSITYPGLQQMLARVKAATSSSSGAAAFCASIGGCSGKCESAVEMAWLGHPGVYEDPFGNAGDTPSAGSAWAAALASGHAHPGDRSPPVGALLIYNHHDPDDPLGHITIYLGSNQVFSTDFDHPGSVGIDPASDIETGSWANSYVGWMDPYFNGQVGS